jgi:beta-glucosidase
MSSPAFYLPPNFLFGVCNSPYHSEGGYNTPSGPHNNWSEWEQLGIIEPSGETNRFWDDWQPHIQKAAEAGLNTFRMGLAWERMQPFSSPYESPEPAWDEAAFERYAAIVGAVYAAGMEPCITLHHFTHPAWIGSLLWTDDQKVEKFLVYIQRAVYEINLRLVQAGYPAIRHYVVFNEPYNTLAGPYLAGDAPPGTIKGDERGFGQATINLLTAYVRAYDIIYDIYAQHNFRHPHVAFNIVSYSVYELDKWYFDVLRAPVLGIDRANFLNYLDRQRKAFYKIMRPLAQTHLDECAFSIWEEAIEKHRFMYADFPYHKLLDVLYASPRKQKIDYIAVDCYDPFVFATLGAANQGQPTSKSTLGGDRFDWTLLTFSPDVTREHLRMHGAGLTDIPLYLLETTIGHNHKKFGSPEPRPDGLTVERFLKRILWECVRLMQEGISLQGFLYWTLCDNYEWGTYTSRLGLVEYDYENNIIKETDAFGAPNLDTYRELINALRSNDPQRIQLVFKGTLDDNKTAPVI